MDLARIVLRLALWFRRPPSLQRIIIFAAVIVLGLAVLALERAGLWPSWMTLDKPAKHMRLPRF
jgi:hypothetical protein